MRIILLSIALLFCAFTAQSQVLKSAGIWYFLDADSMIARPAVLPNGTELAYVIGTRTLYKWNRGTSAWEVNSSGGLTMPFDSITFNSRLTEPAVRELKYSTDYETLVFGADGTTIEIGQKEAWYCKNQSGATITKGTVVRASGTLGSSGRILVSPMVADGTISSKYLLGITASDIANGADGYVIHFGKLRKTNTNSWNEGDVLYASATTPGALTNIEPAPPNLRLPIAFVVNKHAVNGVLAIRIQTGNELHELHDVDTSGINTGEGLVYNSTLNKWQASAGKLITTVDTAAMLSKYIERGDTAGMLSNYPSTAGWGILKSTKTIRADSAKVASRFFVNSNFFPLQGGTLTGTGGAGFVGFPSQITAPGTPASGLNVYTQGTSFNWKGTDGYERQFASTLTGGRTYTLPNASGTFALGTGTSTRIPIWTSANALGDSPALYNSTTKRWTWDSPSILELPMGTDAQRPVTPTTSDFWYNMTSGGVEWYNGTRWAKVLEGTFNRGTSSRIPFFDANGQIAESNAVYNSTTKRWTWDSPSVIELPMGTDAQRPSPATTSDFWYNMTSGGLEWYNGTRWAKALESTINKGTSTRVPYFDANGQLTESANMLADIANNRYYFAGTGNTGTSTLTSSTGLRLELRTTDNADNAGGYIAFGNNSGIGAAIKYRLSSGSSFTSGGMDFFTRTSNANATLTRQMQLDASGLLTVEGNVILKADVTMGRIRMNNFNAGGPGTFGNITEGINSLGNYQNSQPAIKLDFLSGNYDFQTAPIGTVNTAVTLTSRMYLTNAGFLRLGGTSTTNYQLDVQGTNAIAIPRGTVAQRPTIVTSTTPIRFNTDSTALEYGESVGTWRQLATRAYARSLISALPTTNIYTADGTLTGNRTLTGSSFWLNLNSNVGIKQATPLQELDVNGDLRVRDSTDLDVTPAHSAITGLLTRDATGWVGAATLGGGLSYSGGVLSNSITDTWLGTRLPAGNVTIDAKGNEFNLDSLAGRFKVANNKSFYIQKSEPGFVARFEPYQYLEYTANGDPRIEMRSFSGDNLDSPGNISQSNFYPRLGSINFRGYQGGWRRGASIISFPDSVQTNVVYGSLRFNIGGNITGFAASESYISMTSRGIVIGNGVLNTDSDAILQLDGTNSAVAGRYWNGSSRIYTKVKSSTFAVQDATTYSFVHNPFQDTTFIRGRVKLFSYGKQTNEAGDITKTVGNVAAFATDGTVLDYRITRDTSTSNADFTVTSTLLSSCQELFISAEVTSSATDTVNVILPTPSATFKNNKVYVFGDDDSSTQWVAVKSANATGLYYSNGGVKPTATNYAAVTATTGVSGVTYVWICTRRNSGTWNWVLIRQ